MLEDDAEAAVEIRNDRKLKVRRENLDDLARFRIQLPHTGLGEMPVGGFEKSVAIERVNLRRNAIEQALDQIAPPAFVVVFARLAGRGTHRHFPPDRGEGPIQLRRIEREPLPGRDLRIVRPDTFR